MAGTVFNPPLNMEPTRIESLREFVQKNPDDTFARYALCLELRNQAPDEVWDHFQYLLTHHPDYSATYYQAGVFLAERGREAEARQVFLKGLQITKRQGNLHAQTELQRALDELEPRG